MSMIRFYNNDASNTLSFITADDEYAGGNLKCTLVAQIAFWNL